MITKKFIWGKAGFLLLCFIVLTMGGCHRTDKTAERTDSERAGAEADVRQTGMETDVGQAGAETDVGQAGMETDVGQAAAGAEKWENESGTDTGEEWAVTAEDTDSEQPARVQPKVTEADWSDVFDGLNGAAVLYDPLAGQYFIYNRELAETRRSPCSTFKIISSLIGLEEGAIPEEDSTRKWSGEIFWNQEWNRDINFEEAFRTSCIWYFRDVIDQLGPATVERELNRLKYGNCDISDWEGTLNTSNNKMKLRGFWVESSLKISAVEQTEVMERIFGETSAYGPQTLKRLKQAMRLEQTENSSYTIYGKTGMGKADGEVADAWYTGFAEINEKPVYFCVYLGRSEGMDVSSARAREIAVELLRDNCVK